MPFQSWIEDRTIEIEIPKKIVPYLIGLNEKYTEFELGQILILKRTHSIALYEFLKSYAFTKKAEISVEDFKLYLGINKDTDYRNLRRQIIEPAVSEINEKTDLNVSWESIKRGRRVVSIKFHINRKSIHKRLQTELFVQD